MKITDSVQLGVKGEASRNGQAVLATLNLLRF